MVSCQTVELNFELRIDGRPGSAHSPAGDADTAEPAEQLCVDVGGGEAIDGQVAVDGAVVFNPGPSCSDFSLGCGDDFDKCTLIEGEEDELLVAACVASRGRHRVGECCERRQRGDDSCSPGGWCTPLGIGTIEQGPMACRRLCVASTDCAERERCLRLGQSDSGLCVERCQAFGDDCAGDRVRCSAGQTLEDSYIGYCARHGDGDERAECESDVDCGEHLVCEQREDRVTGLCRLLCDAAHACPDGRRCVPLGLADPLSPRICVE
jgi:hypothetical protein